MHKMCGYNFGGFGLQMTSVSIDHKWPQLTTKIVVCLHNLVSGDSRATSM